MYRVYEAPGCLLGVNRARVRVARPLSNLAVTLVHTHTHPHEYTEISQSDRERQQPSSNEKRVAKFTGGHSQAFFYGKEVIYIYI